ncbi:MAG: zf-HC2 domain-containing protein [Oscillospiraceae bacterium]|nr:zf-HC2 domain-containing protein [Oscillospiraceae bacterium]
MKCHIAADLLPLYAEHLTSEETAAELEAHLAECESCAAQYAMIQESGTPAITAPEDIKPLQAVKKRGMRNILIAVIAAVLFVWLFHTFCLEGFLLRSDQIEMHISTYWDIYNYDEKHPGKGLNRYWTYEDAQAAIKDGAQGTLYEMVSVELDGKCLSIRVETHGADMTEDSDRKTFYTPYVSDYALYSVYMLPLVNLNYLRHKSLWSKTSTHAVAEAGSSILIHCKDGDFAYDLRSLAALADASEDGTATLTVGQAVPSADA